MLESKIGVVKSSSRLDEGTQKLRVEVNRETSDALAFAALSGEVAEGNRVLLNTTAQTLGLGTGGLDFVIANLSAGTMTAGQREGHIMKLRYTPLQLSVNTEEEQFPERFQEIADLDAMPVAAVALHSQVALVAAGAKAKDPDLSIAYIMTDSAALPMGVSDLVRSLVDAGLLNETITCGQAFGGMREAVNLYSALAVARERSGADIAIVGQGPGNTGTGTALGYSAIEVGAAINAAYSLKGRPVAVVRMSQADPRERHRLISHHTLTALSRIALTGAMVPLPILETDLEQQAHKELQSLKLFEHHEIRSFRGEPGIELLRERGVHVRSMGRSFEEDPVFFLAGSAAGRCAAEMLSESFWG